MMELRSALTSVRVLETCHNYARADDPLNERPEVRECDGYEVLTDDGELWSRFLTNPETWWGATISLNGAVLSEWVARVPGLYWRRGSSSLRNLKPEFEYLDERSRQAYNPWSKSVRVSGGLGTLRLAPAADGSRLVTLSVSLNASTGFPALLSADVFDAIRRKGPTEGQPIWGDARWSPMSQGWSERFQDTLNLPRGYLVIALPSQLRFHRSFTELDVEPIEIHPCTVMEYSAGASQLFDFVYATADSTRFGYRERLAAFFDDYRNRNERYGRYLLAGDSIEPLWEAEFLSPADLRQRRTGREIPARVADHPRGGAHVGTGSRRHAPGRARQCNAHPG